MASQPEFTLFRLEQMLEQIKADSRKNVLRLEQAVAAMKAGGVGATILDAYDQIQDAVGAVRDAAHGANTALDSQRAIRDAYAAVPDAGDKKFLTDE
ncbi:MULTISPECIES: hypothetical protein [unclassified Nocardiopsis]|uniref:hypothetical protein n=1 Tax=unclassified Nocardiopsis TaxID=2649073 RepID=UPI00135C6012|nr:MULTISPECIES: hypothetical protein [unclassified Nocardiopsis]